MARYDGKLEAAAEQPLALGEWLALLADSPCAAPHEGPARTEAIARYLAVGEGWREDGLRLFGAFAASPRGPGQS